jgi:predicted DNA-binding transcriptional regulator YafY
MNRLERFYKIDQILNDRKIVSRDDFLALLEISLATFKRDLEYMRDRFNAPVIYDADLRGYRYESSINSKTKFSLPGLWFSEQEIFALITMQQLLENLDQGSIIGPHIQPFLSRLDAVISEGESSSKEIRKRIKLVEMGRRIQGSHFFSEVGIALLKRKRIEIQYYSRASNEITLREISPQRLVHSRDNWYLDAWCHMRNDLRGFSLDGIRLVNSINKKAIEITNKKLEQFLASSYGIFSGDTKNIAKLKFTPERARWIAAEQWHPDQIGTFDETGSYILEFPYSDDRELLLDITKHGSAVEVLSPKILRNKVINEHALAFKQYGP